MMWLIALSIYAARSQSEFVARLPSALAGLAVALMIARLTARWLGSRIGTLAGLLQITFVYTIMQAKLAEADMALVAAVCAAMCAFAIGMIDSPKGVANTRKTRIAFWVATGISFLLKGPIGPLFIALAVTTFAFARRFGRNKQSDRRIVKFLSDPIGITLFIVLVVLWPTLALVRDPAIRHDWKSELLGTAAGKFGREPIYFYLGSVPVMLMPWTPFVILGLCRGPNPDLTGPVGIQTTRGMFWRFLLCWFIPGIIFLSVGMKLKSDHYSFPVLPPLTIAAAMGLDFFARQQASRKQALVWPWFLAGCAVAAFIVPSLPAIQKPMRLPIVELIGIIAVGGLISFYCEKIRRPDGLIAAYLLTALTIALGVQTWIMPLQDDFKFQSDFARAANGLVPPGKTIYMLGAREEEQEAQYAYYLRFPMRRLTSVAELPVNDNPIYAIAPSGMQEELSNVGNINILEQCKGLRQKETQTNRLELYRITTK
jgi:4-amino-4-deoxy-L-arabinose transferase-like glycosyltransferase